MDKEKLKKLVQDPKFISGIYNYCDRWCERCSFISRCLNYVMGEEDRDDPVSHDIENEAFWIKIEKNLELAMELLAEMAEEQGIDLNAIDADEINKQRERTREAVESHELSQSANQYIEMIDSWFKTNQDIFKQRQEDLTKELEIGIEEKQLYEEAESIIDATEVIGWYQHQIYVKLMRALVQFDVEEYKDEIQNDSNGSAKVALIGIDRSLAAWGKLIEHFPEQSNSILDILLHLDRLRKKTERTFPNARTFKRPGFDTINGKTKT